MKCENCGAQTPDKAVFCPECGANLAEQTKKKTCPFCGNEVTKEAVFCNNCGERTDGKSTCKNCGNVFDGAFCPECGTKARQKLSDAFSKNASAQTNSSSSGLKIVENNVYTGEKLKRIIDFATPLISLAAISVLLIFSFFIGVKLNVRSSGMTEAQLKAVFEEYGINENDLTCTVFDFFGECYQGLSEPTFWQIFPLVVCTVAVSCNFLAVAGSFAYSVYAVIRSTLNKSSVSLAKPFAVSIATYIACMLVIRALLGIDLSIGLSYASTISSAIFFASLGVPAIVGAAVATFLFGFSFVLDSACSQKAFADKKLVARTLLQAVSIVFVFVAVVLAACGTFSNTIKSLDSDGSVQSRITSGQTFSFFVVLLGTVPPDEASADAIKYGAAPYIGYFGVLACIIFSVAAIAFILVSMSKNKAGFASALSCVGALTGGVMAVIACFVCSGTYIKYMKDQIGEDFGKTTLVSTAFAPFFVSSALLLVAVVLLITAATLVKNKDEKVVIVSENAVKF